MKRQSDNNQRSASSLLRGTSTRRRFLRGAGVVTAGAAALATVGAGTARAGGFALAVPPVTILKLEPVKGGVFQAERIGARSSILTEKWRPTGHIWLRNDGGSTLHLSSMRISYVGAGAPTARTLPPADPVSIGPGDTKAVPLTEDRLHALPVVPVIRVDCYFAGYAPPVETTLWMQEYVNDEAGNAYEFPCKTSDLPALTYWESGSNHGYHSAHGDTLSQRFAYDMHVVRWTGTGWSYNREPAYPGEVVDGSENDHSLTWGVPVYAIKSGTIYRGHRTIPNNAAPGIKGSGAGNCLYIQHEAGDAETGSFFLYAHLQQNSIPEELVPIEGHDNLGVHVVQGQYLGLTGNSGHSGGPHLHFHHTRGMDDFAEGFPIRFKNARYRAWGDGFDPTVPHPFWSNNTAHSSPDTEVLIDADGPAYAGEFTPFGGLGGGGRITLGSH